MTFTGRLRATLFCENNVRQLASCAQKGHKPPILEKYDQAMDFAYYYWSAIRRLANPSTEATDRESLPSARRRWFGISCGSNTTPQLCTNQGTEKLAYHTRIIKKIQIDHSAWSYFCCLWLTYLRAGSYNPTICLLSDFESLLYYFVETY